MHNNILITCGDNPSENVAPSTTIGYKCTVITQFHSFNTYGGTPPVRMLSLLRRMNVFRDIITMSIHKSGFSRSNHFPDRFSTGPVIFPGPVYQPDR